MSRSTGTTPNSPMGVPPDSRVRDFDELDDRTQDFFLSTATDGTVPSGRDLSPGDVVVFTDYYRVQ